ncbi:hypothetical protein M758_8G116500 [Ceratodon purpureus]|uniref:EGF-like domain-containing protein n=1 Tax=Ceratodon purpureus TaxID=3225 RepID=A0A8T0H0A8_CERPU|nr:hypothetical protein KC19_8G120000 [Ceratodon purpureus]KAG0608579.1 hypothetical protein M758_8G116500 [Ceratodon purpureus]
MFLVAGVGLQCESIIMMKLSCWNSCFLVLILLAQTVTVTRTQDQEPCDPRCKTGACDADGNCRCVGNDGLQLAFPGGEFCDQPSHYCSPTAPFYCIDNGGNSTCGLLGVTPTCICLPGYTGDQCQYNGTACGIGYCYNNATCTSSGTCACTPEWQGNANCTLATEDGSSEGSGIKWWGALLITGAVVAVVSAVGAFGFKKYKERTEGVSRFNELKKSQMRGRAESDDDEYDSDPYEDEVAKNNKKSANTTAQP